MDTALVAFKEQILNAKKILITCHDYPDLDAIGSCVALAYALQSQSQAEVVIWVPKENLTAFQFLPLGSFIVAEFPEYFLFDTCIVCDCSNLERVKYYEKIQQCQHSFVTVNIDHHPDNSDFGDINITSLKSSVGEMLYSLFVDLKWSMSADMATCLYAAISFDTGRFAFSNVTQYTLLAAAKLVELGANPCLITRAIDENKSVNDLQLIKISIENLVVCKDYEYAYTVIPKKSPKGSVKVIDTIRQLRDLELFIVFQELQSKLVKVNLRSKSYVNVSKIAQHFGGGGHERAAGILFKQNLDTCMLEVTQYLNSR
tara:strand:- start:188 stop:1132 length:945 start_codon:yes stop_codon:yes gene_type:complete